VPQAGTKGPFKRTVLFPRGSGTAGDALESIDINERRFVPSRSGTAGGALKIDHVFTAGVFSSPSLYYI
jgi:hypothetical protein